jgi:hypothetical protein
MTENEVIYPSYARVYQWIREYGVPGSDDARGARDFIEIEATESISSLRGELLAMSQNKYSDETLDKIVGPGRKQRHGSYAEWAKTMLRWMAKTG